MRQFIIDPPQGPDPVPGDLVTLDSDESHHLLGVLRGAEGRSWCLTDGRGLRFTARVVGRRGRLAELEIVSVQRDATEDAPPRLVLACAVVKGRRFEWLVEKAVELGVHHILPLRTARGIIEPGSGKMDRWRGLARSALKQSGRCVLPLLDSPQPLGAALAAMAGEVFFGALPGDAPSGRMSLVRRLAAESTEAPPTLALCIGPEGGWTPAELEELMAHGALPLDLGPHVLRTETAALAGLALLQELRASWRGVSVD